MNVYSVKYENYELRIQKTKGIYSTFELALSRCKYFIKEYLKEINQCNNTNLEINDNSYEEINVRNYSYDSNVKFPSFLIYKTTVDDDKNDEFLLFGLKEKIKMDLTIF